VLVVDDEEMNRMLLRDPLEAHHFEVEEAENGSEALARAAEQRFDAVLLDLMMPGMDGFEVCRRLKKHLSEFVRCRSKARSSSSPAMRGRHL